MMKSFIFKYKNKEYLVDFYYYNNRTMCRIYREYKFVSEGIVLFNPNDDPSTFSKYFGEKLALTRSAGMFARDLRKAIWNAYKSA